jgi:dihydroorotase
MFRSCGTLGYGPLRDFDTNYKVNPPLREKADNDALVKGLKDGTIDVICSGHTPHDIESKELEFDLAEFGIINLQTAGTNLAALSGSVGWDVLLEKITVNPRKLLDLEIPTIEPDTRANLTLFDPAREWTLNDKTNYSKSRNSPWLNKTLKGKAIAVFNNGRVRMDEQL